MPTEVSEEGAEELMTAEVAVTVALISLDAVVEEVRIGLLLGRICAESTGGGREVRGGM